MRAILCIQCKDNDSGVTGTFLAERRDGFRAVSPVFNDLVELYAWNRANGWIEADPHYLMSDYVKAA